VNDCFVSSFFVHCSDVDRGHFLLLLGDQSGIAETLATIAAMHESCEKAPGEDYMLYNFWVLGVGGCDLLKN
jgi:hypothetical protein